MNDFYSLFLILILLMKLFWLKLNYCNFSKYNSKISMHSKFIIIYLINSKIFEFNY